MVSTEEIEVPPQANGNSENADACQDNAHNDIEKMKESVRADDGKENGESTEEASTSNDDILMIEEEKAGEESNGKESEQNGAEEQKKKENGESAPVSEDVAIGKNGDPKKEDVECIDLDDDDVGKVGPPAAKRAKTDDSSKQTSPVPDDPHVKSDAAAAGTSEEKEKKEGESEEKKKEKEPELINSDALLNKLEEYIVEALDSGRSVERKILDALLGAINVQVQKEPLSVRKLILDKQLVLPNTISEPPSQVVDVLIEHDPEHPLSKVITRMFGEERPKLSEQEKKERHLLKSHYPAPHMTKLLIEIGQDLVQESTYCDIVHARNLPETPKNLDTYKQVAAQLKPVWEALKKKNEPFKMKTYSCQVCGFRTESRVVLADHRSQAHFDGRKYMCGMCPEFDTNESRIMKHYLEDHAMLAKKPDVPLKNPCMICEEDFVYKGQRDQHLRLCKKDYVKLRQIMGVKKPFDVCAVNEWLWEKPPIDPTILAQQQVAQQQQLKQQRAAQQQAAAAQQAAAIAAAQRRNLPALQAAALLKQQQQQLNMLRQQQLAAQQRGGATAASAAAAAAANPGVAAAAALMGMGVNGMNQNSLIAAMQAHLRRQGQSNPAAAATLAAYSKTLQAAQQQQKLAAARPHASTAKVGRPSLAASSSPASALASSGGTTCEICDQNVPDKERYLNHLQLFHKQMKNKSSTDMQQGAPLACSRCKERFWTYEGLERHLVMSHGLVTSDLLAKAQKKEDGGRCKLCGKQYAFNMLQHLVADHQVKLCSAEIMYSCDVCSFKCSSYQKLELHLTSTHPKNGNPAPSSAPQGKEPLKPVPAASKVAPAGADDCIILDD